MVISQVAQPKSVKPLAGRFLGRWPAVHGVRLSHPQLEHPLWRLGRLLGLGFRHRQAASLAGFDGFMIGNEPSKQIYGPGLIKWDRDLGPARFQALQAFQTLQGGMVPHMASPAAAFGA
jgi:hypothetical protein